MDRRDSIPGSNFVMGLIYSGVIMAIFMPDVFEIAWCPIVWIIWFPCAWLLGATVHGLIGHFKEGNDEYQEFHEVNRAPVKNGETSSDKVLESYVKRARDSGKSDSDIQKILVEQGWQTIMRDGLFDHTDDLW